MPSRRRRWIILTLAILLAYPAIVVLAYIDTLWLAERLYRGDGEYDVRGWLYTEHRVLFPQAELSSNKRLNYEFWGFAGGGARIILYVSGVPQSVAKDSRMRFHARLIDTDHESLVWSSTAELYEDPYFDPDNPIPLLYHFRPVVREISRFNQYKLEIEISEYDTQFQAGTIQARLSRGAIDWYGEYRD